MESTTEKTRFANSPPERAAFKVTEKVPARVLSVVLIVTLSFPVPASFATEIAEAETNVAGVEVRV